VAVGATVDSTGLLVTAGTIVVSVLVVTELVGESATESGGAVPSVVPHPDTVRTSIVATDANERPDTDDTDERLMTGGYARTMSHDPTPPSPIVDSPTGWVRDHIERYVASNGADGHDWNGVPCMLLTTKGRRSGRWVRSALIYGLDGDDVVLVASKGGAPENPLWFENLVSHPEVWVQVKGDTWWGRAEVIDAPTERQRLWSLMTPIWPGYDEYQTKAGSRVIPVVRISR